MLRQPLRNDLRPLSFKSLCRRSFLLTPVLPRYLSDWKSNRAQRYTFDKPNPHRKREPRDRQKYGGSKVTLDVNSLGQPGQIVVVPGRGRRRLNRNRNRSPNKDRSTISSMLDDLDDENSDPTTETVQRGIDTSRGPHQPGDTLATGEFKALCSNLSSSFTYRQLSEYVSDQQGNTVELKGKNWTWRPSDKISETEGPKGSQGKARLAERIVRDCWQLVVPAERGQMEFHLKPEFMSLLLHAEHFSFHELASLHGCTINVTRSACRVTISGKRIACESVHEIIYDATARTREEDVGISPYTLGDGINQVFTADFLEWINTTYGVYVEYKAYRTPEKIYYLAENKMGANNARRALNLAITNSTPPSTHFSTYLPASELASVYSYRPEENASWFDRQKPWFRWAMSSSQSAEAETLETPFFDKHQTRLSDELLKLLRDTTPLETNLQVTPGLQESVTAEVGRCLFMQKSSFEETTMSPAQLGRLSLPRTFTNDIPLVSKFLDSLSPFSQKNESELYRIRLTPAADAGTFPELEIGVAIKNQNGTQTSDNAFEIQSVKAILATNAVDYLLPENGLDLRFTRTISQDLLHEGSHSSGLEAMLQSIKQSLQGSFLAGGVSRGPLLPFCNISIPNGVQKVVRSSHKATPNKLRESESPENNVTAEYMFPPISDVRGTAVQTYEFGDRQLEYRHYESGPLLAARSNEISLTTQIPHADSTSENGQAQELVHHEFHSFYNTACDMAFKVHGSRYMD
ncbi:uncharacterized protein N7446_002541 [Penicillium canescens]|uniref:Mitochondrial inner-membrane-bound regulator-domain-containing protein n=1 Tax=Penicillium canescens TaxID=5083 RepID=A0AAD6IEX7_PENCN|nr:uncharacterized protein N7446_002541 [Penicillium canescens]KAJ6044346.1 hypothetical protein N7460_005701 [Penicillium canescens]KAJ6055814.1 hypothetical protein N7444_004912 [Penicillium canescens]KAJ6074764.1 hypothetical protein N7446_002541 [Penicillium canescens]